MTDPAPDADTERKEGTFLVTAVDDDTAVLKDVNDGQVFGLSSNPGVEQFDAVEGTVEADPPLEVSWSLVDVEERRPLSIERSDEPPTGKSRDAAADQSAGELTRYERAGTGEVHVITVPEEDTDRSVDDVVSDEETVFSRAARLGVSRVEVRSEPGVVSVRYVP